MIEKRMVTFDTQEGSALVRLDLISAITPQMYDKDNTSITVLGGRTFTSTNTVEWWKSQYEGPIPTL